MNKFCLLIALIAISLLNCRNPDVNIAGEKEAIRKILQQERKAHFEKDIDLFLSTFADSMISVYDGEVFVNTPEENKARFGTYFRNVEFVKWDDRAEPVIDISDDGTLAYAVIEKDIVITYPDTSGNQLTESTQFSWVSIYKKIDGQWKGVCNASTHKPQ